MFVTFDYRHPDGTIEERFVRKEQMDDQCNDEGEPLVRLPAGTRTTFRHADRRLKR